METENRQMEMAGINEAEIGDNNSETNISAANEGEAEKKISFEEAIGELESIVNKLERGDLDLDASILLFQRGINLTAVCGKILEEAEGKIVKLIKDADGNIAEEIFDA